MPGGKDLYMSEPMVTGEVPVGRAIRADTARMQIGNHDVSKHVPVDASVVRFRVKLNKGPARLQTWFTSQSGESRGAYYVTVNHR